MDTDDTRYTIGDVARIAHLSVRALHHYDELDLLRPSRRSDAGYRLYTADDLARLQQLLFYRELGFALKEIRKLMTGAAFDRRAALIEQRRELAGRSLRLTAMGALIDKTLAAMDGGVDMTDEEMFEVFGDFDPSEHGEEARERWGDTEAYRESARRTAGYSKEDWARFKSESDALNAEIAAIMDAGAPPDDLRAVDAAERHRLLIDRWFYPCSPEMHVELGRTYVADPRFAAIYDAVRPGMARYMCDSIAANAARVRGA